MKFIASNARSGIHGYVTYRAATREDGPLFTFKFRFLTGSRITITTDEQAVALESNSPIEVTLTTIPWSNEEHSPIEGTVVGVGYGSRSEASNACRRWYSAMRVGLARRHAGADFFVANRSDSDWEVAQTREGTEWETGRRVIEDERRQLIYETEPSPRFVEALPGRVIKGLRTTWVADSAKAAARDGVLLSPKLDIACDLFGRAFDVEMPEARLVMLVTAVEALIEPAYRSLAIRDAAAALLEKLDTLDLGDMDRKRLRSQVGQLKKESIKEAGARLFTKHLTTTPTDESPSLYFTACYDLRSRIVHGTPAVADQEEAASRAPGLEIVVGRLIDGVATSAASGSHPSMP
jgi:hypothetical protein